MTVLSKPSPVVAVGLTIVILAVGLVASSAAGHVVYRTGFEASEGYDAQQALIGQQGWVGTDVPDTFSTGLITEYFEGMGQQAYIGFNPALECTYAVSTWHPLEVLQVSPQAPIVQFAVLMEIADSTNGYYDDFRWSVYNRDEKRLLTLDFDNRDLTINFLLEDSTNFVWTGYQFENFVPYHLLIRMDFERNQWSATINGAEVVNGQPITVASSALNLGDIDAVWVYGDTNHPGDNFMVFDDYEVTLQPRAPETPARLVPGIHLPDGSFVMRVLGEPNSNYAVDATVDFTTWIPLRTNNTATAGYFDFVDDSAGEDPIRFYRARWVP